MESHLHSTLAINDTRKRLDLYNQHIHVLSCSGLEKCMYIHALLTLGAHAQRGLRYLVRVSVCLFDFRCIHFNLTSPSKGYVVYMDSHKEIHSF